VIRACRVLSLARNRRTLQRFADRPVPEESLASVLECARYAVSAKEAQPWRFVVVQDAVARHAIAAAAFNHLHVQTAPVLVVCCARIHSHVSGSGRPSYPIDLAAATQVMLLAAADVGLAASWITGFREPDVRQCLDIPRDVPVVALLAIGYPDGIGPLPERTVREEVVAWGRWRTERGRIP
jgi:nitroreductase